MSHDPHRNPLGAMPNFLILGLDKCGTTSLYRYLAAHPAIGMSRIKEPNFFEFGEPEQDPPLIFPPLPGAITRLDAYRRLFAPIADKPLRGEASTFNIEARACRRIRHYLPQAKLICLLRHPVDRAYSAFWMHQRAGTEPETDFRTAYAASARRWQGRFQQRLPPYARRHAGWMADRLEAWLAEVPRERIHIGLFEDLRDDSAGLLTAIQGFLGVEAVLPPGDPEVHNRGYGWYSPGMARWLRGNGPPQRLLRACLSPGLRQSASGWLRRLNRRPLPPLDESLRRELTLPQVGDILRLQTLIGRDLSHWLP